MRERTEATVEAAEVIGVPGNERPGRNKGQEKEAGHRERRAFTGKSRSGVEIQVAARIAAKGEPEGKARKAESWWPGLTLYRSRASQTQFARRRESPATGLRQVSAPRVESSDGFHRVGPKEILG